MSDIQVRVDADGAISLIHDLSARFPKVTAAALNRTAESVNLALREQAMSRFNFRGVDGRRVLNWYAPPNIPKPARARSDKQWVTAVDPEHGGKILRPFETGTPKTEGVFGGVARTPIIPTKAIRPWGNASIPAKYFPTNLFPETRQGAKPAKPLKSGKARRSRSWREVRPFVLDPRIHKGLGPKAWGIYQRIGPKRGDIRMLWAYRPSVHRPKLLDTQGIASRTVAATWREHVQFAWNSFVRRGGASLSVQDVLS